MFVDKLKYSKIIDLTHPIQSTIPTWNGSCGFEQSIKMDYPEGCRVQSIKMHAGVGTHMDAPSHFIQGGASIADIPLEQLIVPACVIDISGQKDPRYELSLEDIVDYELSYGKIPENSLVIAYTGWDKFWYNPKKYRNQDQEGHLIFPTFSQDAASLLVERNVAGIGIDTLSPDRSDTPFPVHHIMLGAGKYIIENLAHCKEMPPHGGYAIVLPLRVGYGTESAIRAVGLIF